MNDREQENPTIKAFRERHASAIRMLFTGVPGSDWPEHQAARLIWNIVAEEKKTIADEVIAYLEPYEGATWLNTPNPQKLREVITNSGRHQEDILVAKEETPNQ